MIVGLTGGIGAGKSTVCGIFKHLGVPVISADEIAHELVDTDHTVLQSIIQKFGKQFLTHEQKLDRRKLRQQIFSHPTDKLWLEQLLHPLIGREIVAQAKEISYPYCIAEIPILVEANMQDIVDRILTVDCSPDEQLKRAVERENFSPDEIKSIIANQITREHRLAVTNDVIENHGDMQTLIKRVEELHRLYLSLSN